MYVTGLNKSFDNFMFISRNVSYFYEAMIENKDYLVLWINPKVMVP